MRVMGVGADWCNKCKSAKEYLKEHNIQWIDYQSEEGKRYINIFHEDNLPFFIIIYDDGTTKLISTMLEAKNYA